MCLLGKSGKLYRDGAFSCWNPLLRPRTIIRPPRLRGSTSSKMGKNKDSRVAKMESINPIETPSLPVSYPSTTSAIAGDSVLGYKIRVLLHDFLNVTKDHNAELRLNSTTDEHYISSPYFDEAQAIAIKAAIVDIHVDNHDTSIPSFDVDENLDEDRLETREATEIIRGKTLEAATRVVLQNFFEKRRASGDGRPCGPHHLAPLYASLFGIDMAETQDSKFLNRLRRAGV